MPSEHAVEARLAGEVVRQISKASASGQETESLVGQLRMLYQGVRFSYTPADGLHVGLPEGRRLPLSIQHFARRITIEHANGERTIRKNLVPDPEERVIGPSVWEWLRKPAL
jgi:hypothetical protein